MSNLLEGEGAIDRRVRSRTTLVELFIALGIVAALLATAVLYARTWPPAVIVESGSMMHPHEALPYGRFGTIDPGDLVLVRTVKERGDVSLATDGGKERYGASGDVIVYLRNGNPRETPIIHRAVAWIDVEGAGASRTYRLWWEGEWRSFGSDGIRFPELGFDRSSTCCPAGAYAPSWSGFVTQGDNPFTNAKSDQALGISREPVPVEWVKGKARGELPWIGLLKLMVAPRENDYNEAWLKVGNAYAPRDCWTMLAVSIALVVVAPIAFDAVRRRVRPE